MRSTLLLTAALLLNSGCPQKAPEAAPAPAPPPAAPPPAAAAPSEPAEPEPVDGGVFHVAVPTPAGVQALDEGKLKRFLDYQASMSKVNQELAEEARKMPLLRLDGGTGMDAAAMVKSVSFMKRENQRRDEVTKASGFSAEQVQEIERMVADFLGQRMMGQSTNLDLMVQQLEEMISRVPVNQREEFQEALRHARAQRDGSKNLSRLRSKYGDANVDLLLQHEAELRQRWNAMAAGFAGVPVSP